MNLANPDDLHVIKIDPIRNLVVIGYDRDLHRWGLLADRLNWVVKPDLRKTRVLSVRVRHRHEPAQAEVRMLGDHTAEIRFFKAQRAVTPGQAVVIYDGNMVLGGGWISESIFVAETERPKVAEAY